ncbi:YkyA family protein [Ornithinibacillus xuwenensis]|uniref:YkyA family protein n=1 Tax=Ornithinibacillus xuwenensis TaxID=3144668 RepID=A0ABU9XE91_9BACI
MKFSKRILLLILLLPLFLTGCGDTPETQIYSHLEEAVKLEEGFQEQQSVITQLEKQEQELYKQIIELGVGELDKIKQLSQEAITSIEERTEKIKLEKDSLDTSQEEFTKTKPIIEEIKDTEIKEKALKMYDAMVKRYEAYEKLYKAYNESLTLEKELYEMLQLEELNQEDLQAQIEEVNKKYQEVIEVNDEFNAYTTEYNELKKGFYEIADIQVKYVESSKK